MTNHPVFVIQGCPQFTLLKLPINASLYPLDDGDKFEYEINILLFHAQPARGELQVRFDADAPAGRGVGVPRGDHRGGETEARESEPLLEVGDQERSNRTNVKPNHG